MPAVVKELPTLEAHQEALLDWNHKRHLKAISEMVEDCVHCGLPIVWLEPRGIWRTADPKDKRTRAPYVCQGNDNGDDHEPKEIVLWQS